MSKAMIPPHRRDDEVLEDEIDLKDILKTLISYKYTILLTTLTIMMFAVSYLYFKPTTYDSYTIVDIKTKKQAISPDEMIFGGMSGFTADEVDKQMALYKTYSANKMVLDKLDFSVQYFNKKDFKLFELYEDAPIEVSNSHIINPKFLSKTFMLTPIDDREFELKVIKKSSFKILDFPLFQTILFQQKFSYGELVKTKDFEFSVLKKADFDEACMVKFNGTKREIYENIIKGNLSINRLDKKSSLIKISYRDNISKRAEKYINTLASIFSEQNILEKSEKNKKILQSINLQLKKIKENLVKSENQIETYKVSNGVVKPNEQSISLIKNLSKIDYELSQARLKQTLLKSVKTSVDKNGEFESISLSLVELGNQKISTLFDALQEAQSKESELALDYKPTFPELKKVQRKIENTKRKILSNIINLQNVLGVKIKELKKNKTKAENILKTLPQQERKLVNFNRNYDVNSKMYTYLLQQRAEKSILQSSILSDFKVVDQAYTDTATAKPKKALTFIVATITGLILGIFLAFIRAFFDDSITDLTHIENDTSIPIFGFIPQVKKKDIKVEVLKDKHGAFAESYREVRNKIRTTFGTKESTTILVTSTMPGEGKTTTSANLAGVLGMADYKCIILNLDMRKPMLHKYFDIESFSGISSYLQNQDRVEDIIYKTEYKNIDIIPAGPTPENPSELLLKQELPELLEELKKSYDYVIIDSAPVGLVTDSLDLMHLVDLSLFIFREGKAKKSYIKNLNRISENVYSSKMAILLNGTHEIKRDYGYGYGYGYGYSNTQTKKETIEA